jgi:endonuclease/exonuclease/phosphatase family metal-dependent hydrolase
MNRKNITGEEFMRMYKKKIIFFFYLWFFLGSQMVCIAQDYRVPHRTISNIVIASYNIKWLGQTPHDFEKLAGVIQNFDVCGILEVKNENSIAELVEKLEKLTHKDWGYVFGMRTNRPHGSYFEAYAAIWRRDRVQLGDGIVSNIWDPEEVYRNDPFLVSFKRKNFDFTLFLVHTRWSQDDEGSRETEVKTLVEQIQLLRKFLNEKDIILSGDFNYSGKDSIMQMMAKSAGLIQIDPNANSTFKNDFSDYASSYDHIYISEADTREFQTGECSILDATQFIFGSLSLTNMKKSKNDISDHLPVWAIFRVNLEDDD